MRAYRFPPDVISFAVWLYYRFPRSLRMDEELLPACRIELSYGTRRPWAVNFGPCIARGIGRFPPVLGVQSARMGAISVAMRRASAT